MSSPQAPNPDQGALTWANNLRIASMTLVGYDYLITLPAELRLYKTASRRSLGFILFVLIRYLSIILFVVSNTSFYYHHFTPKTCSHYFYLAPVFKVLQVMVSQAILAVRTFNIAHRNVWVGRALILAYIVALVFQWISTLHSRAPTQKNGNCMVKLTNPHFAIPGWCFYFTAMLFDFSALSVSTYYLLKAKAKTSSAFSKVVNILLYDGLGYFVVLAAVNIMNTVLFHQKNQVIQTSGSSLGYAVTAIMSQRILIHVREARARQGSVVASPPVLPPIGNSFTSAFGTGGLSMYEPITNGKPSGGLIQEDSYNTRSEYDIEVQVDTSMLRGTR